MTIKTYLADAVSNYSLVRKTHSMGGDTNENPSFNMINRDTVNMQNQTSLENPWISIPLEANDSNGDSIIFGFNGSNLGNAKIVGDTLYYHQSELKYEQWYYSDLYVSDGQDTSMMRLRTYHVIGED